MIKNIHWYLNDQIYTENDDGTGDIALEFAADLLGWLEQDGMLPPMTEEQNPLGWVASTALEWDKEDE